MAFVAVADTAPGMAFAAVAGMAIVAAADTDSGIASCSSFSRKLPSLVTKTRRYESRGTSFTSLTYSPVYFTTCTSTSLNLGNYLLQCTSYGSSQASLELG